MNLQLIGKRALVSGSSLCPHGGAQLPADDVAREVVERGRQINPGLANDLEVAEVSLSICTES